MKVRKVQRQAFTRVLGKLNTEMENENPSADVVTAQFAILSEKASELEETNKKLFEHMMKAKSSETDFETEDMSADEYKSRFQVAKAAFTRFSTPVTQENAGNNSTVNVPQENSRKFRLPKLELKRFNGDPKD